MDKKNLIRIANFCVYQDRTQQEVREKLASWSIDEEEGEEMIAYLITENYLNEERFARIFAGSKFRVKKWGRKKILYELKARKLSTYCIQAGMSEIDPDLYWETLVKEVEKRSKEANLLEKQRVFRALLAKGFESDLITAAWKEVWGK